MPFNFLLNLACNWNPRCKRHSKSIGQTVQTVDFELRDQPILKDRRNERTSTNGNHTALADVSTSSNSAKQMSR